MRWLSVSEKPPQYTSTIAFLIITAVLISMLIFPAQSLANQDRKTPGDIGTANGGTGTLRIILRTPSDSSNLPDGAGFAFDSSYTTGSTTITNTTITGFTTASPYTQEDSQATTGNYRVFGNFVTGYYASVSPYSGTLESGGTLEIQITYYRNTSDLEVNINANGSGGSFSISGPTGIGFPSDFADISGQTSNFDDKIPTGGYTVEFADIPGYNLQVTTSVRCSEYSDKATVTTSSDPVPFSQSNPSTGDVVECYIQTVTGTYTRQTGELNVTITDNGSGGSFSISGPTGQGDPSDFSDLTGRTSNFSQTVPTGTYTVTFTDEAGYSVAVTTSASSTGPVAPAAATPFSETNPSTGTVNEDEEHFINGNYNLEEATLNVNITASGSPGSFSISGPGGFTPVSGQTSNFSSTVLPGTYTVTFTTPSGFDLALSATSFTVGTNSAAGTLGGGDSETVEGVYTEHTGSLQGFIEPVAAKNDGGQWRLKNASSWRDSENVASGIPIGTYTVEFKAITGWKKPVDATVTIEKNKTTTVTGVYSEGGISGSLQVFITSNRIGGNGSQTVAAASVTVSGRIPAGAQWRPQYPITVGPTSDIWYDSGHIVTGLPVGQIGIEFKLVNGYILPDLRGGTIKPGVTDQKTGEYIRPLIIHKSDYDGNGTEDLPVFNESTRVWSVATVGGTGPSATRTILEQKFGFKDDIPATGDYDGDGIADLAVYREKSGEWIVHRQFTLENFGQEDDIPVPGDYNGDGLTDPALYRPNTGEWLIHDINTAETTVINFGDDGYIPVPGNYNGDKNEMTDLGIYHVQSGQWKVAIYHKTKERWTERKSYRQVFGSIGDIPIQGDYDGDGTTDHAYYDRTNSMWNVLDQFEIQHGKQCVIPVPNDWAGLGRVIPAYFNPVTGRWQAVDNLLRTKFGAGCCPLVSGR